MPQRKTRPLPKAGAVFEGTYRGRVYKLRVVSKDGKIAFEFNGRIFPSPSAAAKSITKHEINGWTFWHIDRATRC